MFFTPSPCLRLLLPLLLCLAALPAQAGVSDTFAQWQRLRDPDAGGLGFTEGVRFLTQHPGWPEEKTIRLRTEAAALSEHAPPFGSALSNDERAAMSDYCGNFPPISGRGMLACFGAHAGDDKTRETWLHQGWIQGDFSPSEEEMILTNYGAGLTKTDHLKRIDRLLFEGKVTPAKRMFALVPSDRHALYEARIALIQDEKNAEGKLNKVPAAQRRDPGLLFARIQWRMARGMDDQLAELFLAAPRNVPYPDVWWPSRAMSTREALSKKDYGQALAILEGHGDLKSEALADALWLKGWIILEYRHDAATAYKEFYALYTNVGTPVSKARAAYWAGRAAIKNGNRDIAREWMQKAARHPTVFYGQLAQLSLDPDAPLQLPAAPNPTDADREAFERNEIVAAVRMLDQQGDKKTRDQFLVHLAKQVETPSQFAQLAVLSRDMGGMSDEVRTAKQALRKDVVMIESGWPRIPLPSTLGTEPALALAISRQESEFDPQARSSADARGLMQLLPPTARHVAKKNDWDYNDGMLENPSENIKLGSAYLGQIINGFDGSYILGIGSYNAGPATVRRWIAANGEPPKTLTGAINWIEAIPYAETRNYVMRVLENVQIYRAIEKPDAPPQLAQDLIR